MENAFKNGSSKWGGIRNFSPPLGGKRPFLAKMGFENRSKNVNAI